MATVTISDIENNLLTMPSDICVTYQKKNKVVVDVGEDEY